MNDEVFEAMERNHRRFWDQLERFLAATNTRIALDLEDARTHFRRHQVLLRLDRGDEAPTECVRSLGDSRSPGISRAPGGAKEAVTTETRRAAAARRQERTT